MRIVIVGATGNVGASLLRELSSHDNVSDLVAIARRRPDRSIGRSTFVTADVPHDDLTEHFRGAAAVVHLAWLFQPTHQPMVTWQANVLGSIRVFDAVARAGVPALIYASSVGAYSPHPTNDPVDETWPTHSKPMAAYGREKAYVERVLDAFEARNPSIRVVRLRPAFIFKRESATEQRRFFAGPLLPRRVIRPGRLPVLPVPEGLRFQALHSDDAAAAYALATLRDVRGAFNIAADPVIDAAALAEVMGARAVNVPRNALRAPLAAAWRAHLVPADAALYDLFMDLPLLDTARARQELGWQPQRSGLDALGEVLYGMAEGAGGATPPLAPDTIERRTGEWATGVGER
jgi:UDP-glucose 4-epimerase